MNSFMRKCGNLQNHGLYRNSGGSMSNVARLRTARNTTRCQAVNIVGAWAGAPEVSPESIVCNVKTRDLGITGTEQRKEDLKAAYCWLWEVVPLLSGNEGDLERASRMFLQKLNSIHYEMERLGVFRTERRR